MAMNIKAAMVICLSFIGGMSWMLQQAQPPRETLPAPAVSRARPVEVASLLSLTGVVSPTMEASREELSGRFSHPSAVAATGGAQEAEEVVAVPPPAPPESDVVVAALPPLEYVDVADDGGPYHAYEVDAAEIASIEASLDAAESRLAREEDPGASDVGAVDPQLPAKVYTVARGDNLTRIAEREWNSRDARLVDLLVASNPHLQGRRSRILVGEELVIPSATIAERVLAGDEVDLARVARDANAPAEPETAPYRWYTIRKNDSLTSIARRFLQDGARWREILNMNQRLDPDKIFPGMRIRLPVVKLATR